MRGIRKISVIAAFITCLLSCVDTVEFEKDLADLEHRVAQLESAVAAVNDNAVAVSVLLKKGVAITGIVNSGDGYTLELSDGTLVRVISGLEVPGIVPLIGIDKDGKWIISFDNGASFERLYGVPDAVPSPSATPEVRIAEDGYWEYSMNGGNTWYRILDTDGKPISAVDGKEIAGVRTFFTEVSYKEGDAYMIFTLADGRTFSVPVETTFKVDILGYDEGCVICLSETLNFELETSSLSEIALRVPEGWTASCDDKTLSVTAPAAGKKGTYTVDVIAVSMQGFVKNRQLSFVLNPVSLDAGACREWNDFLAGNERNVLPDFSYAGYDHSESVPEDAFALGYNIYDVTDFGAVADDGISDREAFLAAVKAALGTDYVIDEAGHISFGHKEAADAVIYFPEGEFILHSKEDDVDGASRSIIIRAGNLVFKGAGRDRTFIVMKDEMLPSDEKVLYGSPDMIQFKHNSSAASFTSAVKVAEDAEKGSFSLKVSSASSIAPGDWVCLYVCNADSDYVASELYPYSAESGWEISRRGVEVIDYHQVKSVNGDVVTFVEPLMHKVEAGRGWEILRYPHYENVGIEDVTFIGYAKADFAHHASWKDDGGFKPVSMNRLVNSWIRRVGFESVSEACSIINSANVSAYDIVMTGNRGHSAVRAQASSRVLIAATKDETSGAAGNFHAVGVSRQSIGTVIWRNVWGGDSCFESHATQPRATLIDCCSGGWMKGRPGGDTDQLPHHLDDLVIWNFNATGQDGSGLTDYAGFTWWDASGWKFLPPVIVGFQSDFDVIFSAEQTKVISTQGMEAEPQSLYEAQLRHRLGAVPAWINTLK